MQGFHPGLKAALAPPPQGLVEVAFGKGGACLTSWHGAAETALRANVDGSVESRLRVVVRACSKALLLRPTRRSNDILIVLR